MKQLTVSAWRLIFSAVAEPRISGKPAKSREIHNNVRNTAKFARNFIKYLSIQHIWKLSRLLGLFNCRKLANLPWNFITTMREQCLKITSGSRGDVFAVRTSKPVKNLWKNGLFWSRFSFVTHSIDGKPRDWGIARSADGLRSPFGRRAVHQRGYGLWLLIFKSLSGSDKKRRNCLQ